VDIARRSQNPGDLAFAAQQVLETPLLTPGSSGLQRRRRGSDSSAATSHISRHSTLKTDERKQHMESSVDGSTYGQGYRSQSEEPQARSQATRSFTSDTDGEQNEDLFIAAASSSKVNGADATSRADRLRVSQLLQSLITSQD
jgi:2-keto-3-deoxy-galactonokinase